MPHAAVIPDGHVVLAPLEPYLGVVILGHKVEKVAEEHVGLVLGHTVDALGEALVDVDRLPPRYRCQVSVNGNGVLGPEEETTTHDSFGSRGEWLEGSRQCSAANLGCPFELGCRGASPPHGRSSHRA